MPILKRGARRFSAINFAKGELNGGLASDHCGRQLGQGCSCPFDQTGQALLDVLHCRNGALGGRDNRRESTTWYEVALWEEQGAGVIDFLKKGKQVMVVGDPGSRAWKDKDGTPQSTNTISARTVQLLGRSGFNRPEEGDWFAQQDALNYAEETPAGGDIPF